jgi:hypothetical protein
MCEGPAPRHAGDPPTAGEIHGSGNGVLALGHSGDAKPDVLARVDAVAQSFDLYDTTRSSRPAR